MTDADREQEIKARCERATPGPWDEDGYCRVLADPSILCDDEHDGPNIAYVPAWGGDTARPPHSDNMIFIAHSREDVPWLLARLDAANARIAALESAGGAFLAAWDEELDPEESHRFFAHMAEAAERWRALAASSTGAGGDYSCNEVARLLRQRAPQPATLAPQGSVRAPNEGSHVQRSHPETDSDRTGGTHAIAD